MEIKVDVFKEGFPIILLNVCTNVYIFQNITFFSVSKGEKIAENLNFGNSIFRKKKRLYMWLLLEDITNVSGVCWTPAVMPIFVTR